MRLVGPPPLTYWPENHIPMGEFVSFFIFSHFQVSLDFWFKCVFGYLNAWVLLWDEFRWKPNTLGGVGTCLGLILDDASLKMSKNCFCQCSYVCGLGPMYAACIHAYAALFLCTQVCSWGSMYVGMDLRMRGLVCVRGFWPAYVGHLAKALLFQFSLIFQPFHLHMQF